MSMTFDLGETRVGESCLDAEVISMTPDALIMMRQKRREARQSAQQ